MFQEKALAILKSGKNVFLTGSAGAGKTYTLNQYIKYLKAHKVPVAITASTGIAATHMNGTTIHSWSGIGIKNQLTHTDLKSMQGKQYLLKNITKTHVLIIDEVSMLHRNQLDMINQALKYLRNTAKPFGGMQVVFAGDFFQLPPVSREQEPSREKFAFMSKAWVEAAPTICYLTEQFRQSKNELNTILNQIRSNEIDESAVQLLQETRYNEHTIEPTKLYSHNADVDTMNEKELEALEADKEEFFAKKSGNIKMMEGFVKSLIVRDKLVLKKGAKVMFLKNDHERGVMNGTLGVVTDFSNDADGEGPYPLVQLMDKRKVLAKPEVWSINNEKGTPIVSFEQVPLRLAWAITVHKSQGMTLEAAEIDLSKAFEPGQGYVALSRLKELDGLRLLGINRMAIEVDPLALKADERFQELSTEIDMLTEEDFQKDWESHIIHSGGTTDEKELKKHRNKKAAKEKKISTHEVTIQYIEQGMSLKEIVNERGMALSTIQGHILTISDKWPDIDISAYRPEDILMDRIQEIYTNADKKAKDDDYSGDGRLKSSIIFRALEGKVDYSTIKLAYAYLDV
ncbi:MAG: helicase [Bacteroidetes bacterium]|nr:MAG: helicase [Bacteroidota bacterium]